MSATLLLSCEHGGNRVPARYRAVLAGAGRALASHRGYDAGALPLARELAQALGAPLVATTVTRLLVDANRSRGHPRLFSDWTRRLTPAEREELLARWWLPHRAAVEARARACAEAGRTALHVSVHSFTPRWKGRARPVDVGLLYDPARPLERAFARAWAERLRRREPRLRVRANQPYRGDADGLTTSLRGLLPPERYLGLELEVSQRFPAGDPRRWRRLRRALRESLAALTTEC